MAIRLYYDTPASTPARKSRRLFASPVQVVSFVPRAKAKAVEDEEEQALSKRSAVSLLQVKLLFTPARKFRVLEEGEEQEFIRAKKLLPKAQLATLVPKRKRLVELEDDEELIAKKARLIQYVKPLLVFFPKKNQVVAVSEDEDVQIVRMFKTILYQIPVPIIPENGPAVLVCPVNTVYQTGFIGTVYDPKDSTRSTYILWPEN